MNFNKDFHLAAVKGVTEKMEEVQYLIKVSLITWLH